MTNRRTFLAGMTALAATPALPKLPAAAPLLEAGNVSIADMSVYGRLSIAAVAPPGGYMARGMIEARIGQAGSYRAAGMFIDVLATGVRTVRIAADQVVI